jgi:hypothetical protein
MANLGVKVGVYLSRQGLGRRTRYSVRANGQDTCVFAVKFRAHVPPKLIGAGVPPDIGKRVKGVGDARNGLDTRRIGSR